MRYAVLVTPAAQEEIEQAFAYIHRDAPQAAQRWLVDLKSHRIIFRIEQPAGIVRVLGVRHGARLSMGEPAHEDEDIEES